MRVLIVDDEPLELLNLESIFAAYDPSIRVVSAQNGMEALQILAGSPCDIVCLDIQMPGLNGIETLERIRERWPDIKAALVSAYGEFHYAKAAMELGVSGYILKPVVPEELVKTYRKMRAELEAERNMKPLVLQAVVEKWLGLAALRNDALEAGWRADIPFEPNLVVVLKTEDAQGQPADQQDVQMEVGSLLTDAILAPQPVEGYWVYFLNVKDEQQLACIRETFSRLKLGWMATNSRQHWTCGIGERVESPALLRKSFYTAVHAVCNKEDATISQCIAIMASQYAEPLTLHDLSLQVHVSPSHLSRIFKKKLGITFVDVLTRIRIDKAKELLANPLLSVEYISHSVGFGSPNYFAVTFRKLEGQSPREYRVQTGV